jgi:hypothetical protein
VIVIIITTSIFASAGIARGVNAWRDARRGGQRVKQLP